MNDSYPEIYRKLHDVGVFLIGVSAVIACTYLLFHQSAEDKIKMQAMRSIMNMGTETSQPK